jgi:hypothetical protein
MRCCVYCTYIENSSTVVHIQSSTYTPTYIPPPQLSQSNTQTQPDNDTKMIHSPWSLTPLMDHGVFRQLCWVFDPAPGKPLVHQPAIQNHCLNQPDLRQTDMPPFSHGFNEGYNNCSTDTYFSTQLFQGPYYYASICLFMIPFSLSFYDPFLIVSLWSLSHFSLWSLSHCL